MNALAMKYNGWIEEALKADRNRRDGKWTESISKNQVANRFTSTPSAVYPYSKNCHVLCNFYIAFL